ncbi:MAG: nucleotide exchange factor GrpE [Desulfobacteraceae bacterium]|nr:nucleotide exchange factor GrpE [Desulfobacteraceae bacterium]
MIDYLFKFVEWLRKFIDRKLIIPAMIWTINFCSAKIGNKTGGDSDMSDWKKTAMKDFKFWLEDLPDLPPDDQGTAPESVDLFTLLSEFSALRQEIKMQNREQNKSLQTLESHISLYRDAANLFNEKARELPELEERIRTATEKRTVIPFLDMRDALIRGLKSSREIADSKGLFKSAPKGIEGIVEGYEMAIRRFDNALELAGIHPVNAIGRPFDPKTMKAVDKQTVTDKDKGLVIDELLSGFVRKDEILRFAEVVVNT